MHIERTLDRAHMSHEEIQRVLRAHIEKETGRKIDEKTFYIHSESDNGGRGTQWTVSVRLLDVKPAPITDQPESLV